MNLALPCLLLSLVLGLRAQSEPLSPRQAVDLVLDCWFVKQGGRLTTFGGGFNRDKALFVLRNISVPEDESSSTWTGYEPRDEDRDLIIFEGVVSDVPIPDGDLLLHADCGGQDVSCEIASFHPERGPGEEEEDEASASWFIGSLRIEGGALSICLVMRNVPVPGEERVGRASNEGLNLPLSARGTISLSVNFLVFTRTPTIKTGLGQSVLLDCGFAGGEGSGVSVEWRLQHKGSGRMVYTLTEGEGKAKRLGAEMDLEKVLTEGNVSLRLDDFTVRDEGTYICTVRGSVGQAQQTIQVQVLEPPQVRLLPEVLYFREGMRETLSCEIGRYYPLDVTVTWSLVNPLDNLGARPMSPVTYTSHRQNKEGTFNITAQIELAPGPDETEVVYTCEVSHVALETPLSRSLRLRRSAESTESSHSALYGTLIASVLFVLAIVHYCRQHRGPAGPLNGAGQAEVRPN
ncbi:tapasin-related protein-like isoform X2 [Heptranchias perlo]|uniref:tapasin-related protein-like isoform X2 n=1 Tax=Heptranchias perlo TaxID=212740 RepID=UPI00355A218A